MSTLKVFACPGNVDSDLVYYSSTFIQDQPDSLHTEECRVIGAHGSVIKYVKRCDCGKKHDFIYDTTNNVGDNGSHDKEQQAGTSSPPS